jgi:hypothetical protein
MNRKFKLLKDLPNLKAGAVFYSPEPIIGQNKYIAMVNSDKFHYTDNLGYSLETLLENPDWFEEIKEPKKYIGEVYSVTQDPFNVQMNIVVKGGSELFENNKRIVEVIIK